MINHTEFGCIATKRSRCNNFTVYGKKIPKRKIDNGIKHKIKKTVTTLHYL